MYPWRRFKSPHASCVRGEEKGINYTSHHLRCERIDSTGTKKLRRRTPEPVASRSWPGAPVPSDDEEDSFSNVFTPQRELRYTDSRSTTRSSSRSTPPSRSRHFAPFSLPKAPPQCRLPTSMRFTTLLVYLTLILLFVSTASAAPLQNRQSIPDANGNTGNDPAPVKSQPPPITLPPSATATTSEVPSSLLPPTATPTSGRPNGNSTPSGDGLGLNSSPSPPPPPASELRLTKPQLAMSPGAIAGIVGGGVVFIGLALGLAIFLYRRSFKRPDITEIPIRRSKLGSRLGRRVFGERSPSPAASRRDSVATLTGDFREKQTEAWLDKGTISRPKPAAWRENGLLGVPRPAFLRSEKERTEEGERWVDKGTISAPRPGRPASAEPLGRLSGMGMGMGYLK